jgi:hypothetical protein
MNVWCAHTEIDLKDWKVLYGKPDVQAKQSQWARSVRWRIAGYSRQPLTGERASENRHELSQFISLFL